MKVLHVVPYFYPAWAYGGIPRLSYHLCGGLARLGIQVDVVTTDALDSSRRRSELSFAVEGVKVRAYRNLSNCLAYNYQFFAPGGVIREKQAVAGYDLVHIHGHRNLLNSYMGLAASRAGVPVVMQPNGTLVNIERRQNLKRIYDFFIGNRQVRQTDIFIAVSEAEKRQFTSMGVSEERIKVIPNGVFIDRPREDLSFKERFAVKGDYILYLGKLTPRKGIECAVRALGLLPDKNMLAVIAGNDMGMLAEIKALVGKLGLRNRVVFTGLLVSPWKELAFKEAVATVYAGQYEIFGLVQFESILCGTPAIVADDCGAGEWIKKSGGGYVVPYGDAAAIAGAVIKLRTRDCGTEKAAEWIRNNLNWDKISGDTAAVYRKLIRT